MDAEVVNARALNARLIVDAAAEAGVDEEVLFSEVGLDRAALARPWACIEYRYVRDLWEAASRLSGDEFFGLHAAERQRIGFFGPVGFAVRSCADGREALERAIDYARRYFGDTDFELTSQGAEARFGHRFRHPELTTRHAADYILACLVVVSRRFTGVDWAPSSVALRREAPSDTSEYERLFRVCPSFGSEWNTVDFDRRLLELPLRAADGELFEVLDREVDDLLERLPRTPDLTAQVRRALARALRGGDPGLEATARVLTVSPRTLQRRLRQEGTSHRRLLDAMRSEFARRFLMEPGLSVAQVGRRLGFRDTSAFHRAFRRWTGTSPSAFREDAARTVPPTR